MSRQIQKKLYLRRSIVLSGQIQEKAVVTAIRNSCYWLFLKIVVRSIFKNFPMNHTQWYSLFINIAWLQGRFLLGFCFEIFWIIVMVCAIWYHLYNFKNVKNIHHTHRVTRHIYIKLLQFYFWAVVKLEL